MSKSTRNRRIITVCLLIAMLVLCSVFFVACGNDNADTNPKSVTVYIGDATHAVNTTQPYLLGLLDELKGSGIIASYSKIDGVGDAFITAIDGLTLDPNGGYVALYHTINDVTLKSPKDDPTTFYETVQFGKTFYYSGAGVATLPLKDGASYWFAAEVYNG